MELRHAAAGVEVSDTGLLLLSDHSVGRASASERGIGATTFCPHLEAEIATLYRVSGALCEWWPRVTGVDVQMRRAS